MSATQLHFDDDAAPGTRALQKTRARETAGPKRPTGAGDSVQLGTTVRARSWKRGDARIVCAITGGWAWVAPLLAGGEIGPMTPEPTHLLLPVERP